MSYCTIRLVPLLVGYHFNKTVIPFALVVYELIANAMSSYTTRANGITVKYSKNVQTV